LNADFTEDIMELNEFLNSHKTDILNEAAETLQRAQLKSYSASTSEKIKTDLNSCFSTPLPVYRAKILSA
jgi:hypothetical protein